MIAQIPGAADLVCPAWRRGGGGPGRGRSDGGGLLGKAMGAVSSLTGGSGSGGIMAMGQTLMSEGLEMGQIQTIAQETFGHSRAAMPTRRRCSR